jgi:amino acid adenylation domain-containing protein
MEDSAFPTDSSSVVHSLFARVARRAPHRPAIRNRNGNVITYAQLDAYANAAAASLAEAGVHTERAVGMIAESTVESIVSALAILKSGGVCVPLDPAWPPPRLVAAIDATDLEIALVPDSYLHSGQLPKQVRTIAAELDPYPRASNAVSTINVRGNNLAYVLFTSGTTGNPKVVGIPHRAIVNLVTRPTYGKFGAWTTAGQVASPSFDVALMEVWGPLLNEGTCIPLDGEFPTPAVVRELIRDHGVNTLLLTTTLFNAIADLESDALAGLEWLYVAGEVFSIRHALRAAEDLTDTAVINCYGPTECTCFSTTYRVPIEDCRPQDKVPIGAPLQNMWVRVLATDLTAVPSGGVGELCIGGLGQARGYLNDARLTAERFVPDPVGDPGGRLYRTGDFGYESAEGVLNFVGRRDRQIKVRGHRVECDEVEAALRAVPGVATCAVQAGRSPAGTITLVAFVVPAPGVKLSPRYLRQRMGDVLPAAAVPTVFYLLDTLPVNANRKTDYMALAGKHTAATQQRTRDSS